MKDKIKYRNMMFDGKLYMPKIKNMKKQFGKKVYSEIQNMFEAMWFHYLKNGEQGTISLPYWAKRINNPKAMNIALAVLDAAGWVKSVAVPGNNWGEAKLREEKLLSIMDAKELAQVRKTYKFAKYILREEDEAQFNNITKINGVRRKTGIVREGFRKTGNTKFQFDTTMMEAYKDEVIMLVNKGINKMINRYPQILNDLANYAEVGEEVVEHYIWNDGTYSSGQNYNDSRGRNIAGYLNKIGNPVGFKIMRALLVIPEQDRNVATEVGLKNKYLFIAELLGYKHGNVAGKVNFGRRAYFDRQFHSLGQDDIDDLYENIWLERMYDELDYIFDMRNQWKKRIYRNRYMNNEISMSAAAKEIETFDAKRKWYVPIEIDMSASVLGIMGLLMNHKPFLKRTNMIGSTIQDAWDHDVITNRIQFKTIMRVCYGSNMPANEMWKDMDIDYTTEEVMAFEKELETGSISVANKFKDFIIGNVKPKEKMKLNIDGEQFEIECNKYFHIGETTSKFDLYDSYSKSIKRIVNTETVKRPDLKSFKRFFVTALIHNLDGQVEDNTVNAVFDAYNWILDLHDAQILCCEAATYARDVYCSGNSKSEPSLERIHRERNNILNQYFKSIGINALSMPEWKKEVVSHVQAYEKPLKCNRIVLK